jgi:hypothetical protein
MVGYYSRPVGYVKNFPCLCHVTVMDQRGQVLRSGPVANLQSEIERFLEGLEAMEAVILALGEKSRVHGLSINPSHHEKEGITAPSSYQLHVIEPIWPPAGG